MDNPSDFFDRPMAVTGATGMVGCHLVAELLRAGYRNITLVVRRKARVANIRATLRRLGVAEPEGVLHIVETELDDPARLTGLMPHIDTLFNCAARIMSGRLSPQELIDNNVSIARCVTDWCLQAGIRKLLHISSISALGDPASPGEPVTETCEPDDIAHYAAYGRSKYYAEEEIRRGAAAGLPVVTVLPGVILGEGDPAAGNSAALIPAISCGQPFYTNGLMAYVDVHDVARALVLLDSRPDAVGQRFILSAGDLSYRQLITLSARAAGRPRPFIPIGRGAVNLAYDAMQAAIRLHLIADRGVTRENLGSVLRHVRYDGNRIVRRYGFRYTPLEETIRRVVHYYRPRKTERS